MLARILDARPDDRQASDLLASLEGVEQRVAKPEPRADLDPPVAARTEELAARFRGALRPGARGPAGRLRSLLRRVEAAQSSARPEGGGS